jgi:uncharacterized protein (TIGR00299 family) protein
VNIAYLDCFSGIAGDMLVGALLDAGLSFETLNSEIAKLGLNEVTLSAEPTKRKGIAGTDFKVAVGHDHHHRSLTAIEKIINQSALDEPIKATAIRIFRRLGEAEAGVHGIEIEKVHFHEVGALDAIVDIVGAAIGFHHLGIDRVVCSPINVGSGTVKAAHGVMPVPAPATAALLSGVPTYVDGPAMELTTPTGAAIAVTMSASFGSMPAITVSAIGYGAGDNDLQDRANVLRVLIGQASAATESTEVWVIEADIDDMSPQIAGYARERLIAAGALDATLTPVFMKKDRPGYRLSVLASLENREALADLVFAETTTFGLRMYAAQRRVLDREWKTVDTPYGEVRVKIASQNGAVKTVTPEYEDCKKLALEKGVPLKDVLAAAANAAH